LSESRRASLGTNVLSPHTAISECDADGSWDWRFRHSIAHRLVICAITAGSGAYAVSFSRDFGAWDLPVALALLVATTCLMSVGMCYVCIPLRGRVDTRNRIVGVSRWLWTRRIAFDRVEAVAIRSNFVFPCLVRSVSLQMQDSRMLVHLASFHDGWWGSRNPHPDAMAFAKRIGEAVVCPIDECTDRGSNWA